MLELIVPAAAFALGVAVGLFARPKAEAGLTALVTKAKAVKEAVKA